MSMVLESPNWIKVLTPSSLRWTLIAGVLSCVSVFAALRSYDYIPQWLTQAFIGLEPFFGTIGLIMVAQVVTDEKTKKGLLEKLPANWWLFFGGLLLVVIGVVMMCLSRTNSAAKVEV
jgi:uncharacterized membrane protein YdcZ (DUF606 family)